MTMMMMIMIRSRSLWLSGGRSRRCAGLRAGEEEEEEEEEAEEGASFCLGRLLPWYKEEEWEDQRT